MNCKICNEPIVLAPSAAERAKKFGGKPSDYTKLFTTHTDCALAKRKKDTSELMRRIRERHERERVVVRTFSVPLNQLHTI